MDSVAEHEKEVACSFEKISEFESNGYILTSYAKKGSLYHAIFLVPFSNPKALEKFIDSIAEDLKKEDVRIALRWGGGKCQYEGHLPGAGKAGMLPFYQCRL